MAQLWVAMLVALAIAVGSVRAGVVRPYGFEGPEGRRLGLVDTSFVLDYHGGPILSSRYLPIYIIWYGRFTPIQRSIILDFIGSFAPPANLAKGIKAPSVATWWSPTAHYVNKASLGVSKYVRLLGQVNDNLTLGKKLSTAQVESLITKYVDLKTFPLDPTGIYLVLTTHDVLVDGFCWSSCGTHATVAVAKKELTYAWLGDPTSQCLGQCAWPFSPAPYGDPSFLALKSPNNDTGTDGMIITIATLFAGAATNPQSNGYYQGQPGYELEAATACQGLFGPGSWPGYPGNLLKDSKKASFNAYGINGREYLLPALWYPVTKACKTLPS